jgi:hypothetical protein
MPELLLSFGPVAFGTVALVVIWKVIVAPELKMARDSNAANAAAWSNAITEIQVTTKALSEVAVTQRETAWILRDTIKAIGKSDQMKEERKRGVGDEVRRSG